jgi:hypothetical protein
MRHPFSFPGSAPHTSEADAEPSADSPMSSLMGQRRGGPERLGALRGGSLRQIGGVGMLQRHAAEFALDDRQMDRLDALRVDNEIEKVDLQAALQKAKIRLRAKIRDLATPEADVLAAIDEVGRCEGELRKMRYRHLKSAHAVLNDEQRSQVQGHHRRQIQERLEERRTRHREP